LHSDLKSFFCRETSKKDTLKLLDFHYYFHKMIGINLKINYYMPASLKSDVKGVLIMGKIPNNSSTANRGLPPSYAQSVKQESAKQGCSITNLPKDQMTAFVNNITNATQKNLHQEESILQKNLKYIKEKLPLPKGIRFILEDKELHIKVLASEGNIRLPILEGKAQDIMELSFPLPSTLQKQGFSTILDLLKKEFPKLTASSFFNEETKIPKFVFSSAIPVNEENKGNFFPQIEAEGEIAYVAWDSSGSRIARGFVEETCSVLFENAETFSGVALSTENFEGIEKGAGVSDHFMASKITIIAILVVKSSRFDWQQNRIETDSFDDSSLVCDGPSHTPFGMLGCQGVNVSSNQKDLSDRKKRAGEKLIPLCLEIVPQFSSERFPVKEDDLLMAIEMQFQKMAFEQIRRF
jgi:hypothetical protein